MECNGEAMKMDSKEVLVEGVVLFRSTNEEQENA
jgi:hypothetical protein